VLGALDDDFDTPAALAILFQFVRAQNRRPRPAAGSRALLRDLDRVFGFLASVPETSEDDAWVTAEVKRRDRLRRERRFAEADEIRERLREEHVVVEDTGVSSRCIARTASGCERDRGSSHLPGRQAPSRTA
jgi:cysteinyl-tRNA synthetase